MWTLAQYQKLCAALASGAKRVRYDNGNEVEYQTTSDMLDLKASMEKALGLDASGNPVSVPRYDRTVAVYSSGR